MLFLIYHNSPRIQGSGTRTSQGGKDGDGGDAAATAQKKLPATAASSNPLYPLMTPWVAKSFYGMAAGYLSYDIGCEVLRKHRDGHDNSVLVATVAHGLTFHALLSFTLPAFVM